MRIYDPFLLLLFRFFFFAPSPLRPFSLFIFLLHKRNEDTFSTLVRTHFQSLDSYSFSLCENEIFFFIFIFLHFHLCLACVCAQKPTISWLMAYRMFALCYAKCKIQSNSFRNERTQCARIQDGEFDCCEMTTNFSRARAAETMRWINCGILNFRRRGVESDSFGCKQTLPSQMDKWQRTNSTELTNEWSLCFSFRVTMHICSVRSE